MSRRVEKIISLLFPNESIDFSHENIALKCPFHKGGQESHPSFYINKNTGVSYCHTCHEGWTLHSLLKKLGWTTDDIEDIVITLPKSKKLEKINYSTSTSLGPIYDENFLSVYSDVVPPLLEAGFSDKILKDYNIKYNEITKQIIFPLRDHRGNLVCLQIRNPPTEALRYYYSFFDITNPVKVSNYIWGLYKIYDVAFKYGLPYLVIVEGAKKVLWLAQNGVSYVIALDGSYMSRTQLNLLSRFNIEKLIIMTDNDPAGKEAAGKISQFFMGRTSIAIPKYPEGKTQPDELTEKEIENMLSVEGNYLFNIFNKRS